MILSYILKGQCDTLRIRAYQFGNNPTKLFRVAPTPDKEQGDHMIKSKRYILEAFILATGITAVLLMVTILIAKQDINWIETVSVYFSFACTWLCTRQVRFNYVLGVISTSLLVFTFWQAGLYGSMVLNMYLIPTVIYGWFIWGKDTNPRPVERVKPKNMIYYIVFTAATWTGAYLIITKLGGELVALDGWLLVGSVLAQFLLDRKKIETWIVWILVNVVSVYVFFESGLYLLAGQFVLFLANAIFAYTQWRKSMKATEALNALLIEETPENDNQREIKSSFGGRFTTVAAKQSPLSKAQAKDLKDLLISPKHQPEA